MKTIYIIILSASALLLFTGCASTRSVANATVCPDCRTVTEEVPEFDYEGELETRTYYHHKCEGCQGAFTTLFKEGKLKHKCSICTEEGYTCPILHPVNLERKDTAAN